MIYADFELNRPNHERDILILNWIAQHYDNTRYRSQGFNGFNDAFYSDCLKFIGMNDTALNELLVSKLVAQYTQSKNRVLK